MSKTTKKWVCILCDVIYNPDQGDNDNDIPPGTSFDDLPENWVCPFCGAKKELFEEIE